MKKFFKWFGIAFLLFLAMVAIAAFLGKDKTAHLVIKPVDLALATDGTFLGTYDGYRFTNIVEVTIEYHQIQKIDVVKTQREEISQELAGAVIVAQSPVIDAVSGATLDQNAFLKAVESALLEATNAE